MTPATVEAFRVLRKHPELLKLLETAIAESSQPDIRIEDVIIRPVKPNAASIRSAALHGAYKLLGKSSKRPTSILLADIAAVFHLDDISFVAEFAQAQALLERAVGGEALRIMKKLSQVFAPQLPAEQRYNNASTKISPPRPVQSNSPKIKLVPHMETTEQVKQDNKIMPPENAEVVTDGGTLLASMPVVAANDDLKERVGNHDFDRLMRNPYIVERAFAARHVWLALTDPRPPISRDPQRQRILQESRQMILQTVYAIYGLPYMAAGPSRRRITSRATPS